MILTQRYRPTIASGSKNEKVDYIIISDFDIVCNPFYGSMVLRHGTYESTRPAPTKSRPAKSI